jgi:hypothetical protein
LIASVWGRDLRILMGTYRLILAEVLVFFLELIYFLEYLALIFECFLIIGG